MRLLQDDSVIWDRIYEEYSFCPKYTNDSYRWLNPSVQFETFFLPEICWNEEQERLVNSFFRELDLNGVYALDWQHDCFNFDPQEEVPLGFEYSDEQRQCNVYFPSYYPNGDYHFFIDNEWKYGLMGHPWLLEIVVTGEELIQLFKDDSRTLGIKIKQI